MPTSVAKSIRNEAESRDARDIGSPPECVNEARRAACKADLSLFLKSYFPWAFPMAWCPDHLTFIEQLQTAITQGGLFAGAMPRGTGKTTICVRGAIYAHLYGFREFTCLVGASESHAKAILRTIQDELRFNDLLAEDFPEACHSLRALEGEPRRCRGQTINGMRTDTIWSANQVRFPNIPEEFRSFCRGSVISVAGLTGSIRGQQVTRYDGKVLRPSLVLLDDPQTRESAESESQCRTREKIVSGDVLGLAGPGVKVAAVMPCTVIRRGDLADRMLDRKSHPDWNGTRTKMVYAFPEAEKLWDEYRLLRAEGLAAGDNGAAATAYYKANQESMDAGSQVAWPERFNHDELSAIQHAMNLRFRDEDAFQAEYQNEPNDERRNDVELLKADEICARVNRIERGVVPRTATRLTAMIDVQQKLLWWLVAAWEDDFTGYVVDYGAWPDQGRNYYTLHGASKTIEHMFPGQSLDAQIYGALGTLVGTLAGHEWQRDAGGVARIERIMIDANWGPQTDTVYRFCRQSPQSAILLPSHGRYIGATSKPMHEYERRQGERVGLNWRISLGANRSVPHVSFDANWWKSFIHTRLYVDMGGKSALTLYGSRPQLHQMLADHLLSEEKIRVDAKGRTVDEWKLPPNKPDNHLFDCLVGAAVAANIGGSTLSNTNLDPSRKRLKFSEIQAKKR